MIFFIKPIMMFPIVIHIQDNPKSSSSRLVTFFWILVYDSVVFYAIFNLFLLLFLVDFRLWCYVFLFIYLFMIFSWILFYGVIGVLSIFALQFSHINLSLMLLIVNSSYQLISGKNGYDFKSVRRWTSQNK